MMKTITLLAACAVACSVQVFAGSGSPSLTRAGAAPVRAEAKPAKKLIATKQKPVLEAQDPASLPIEVFKEKAPVLEKKVYRADKSSPKIQTPTKVQKPILPKHDPSRAPKEPKPIIDKSAMPGKLTEKLAHPVAPKLIVDPTKHARLEKMFEGPGDLFEEMVPKPVAVKPSLQAFFKEEGKSHDVFKVPVEEPDPFPDGYVDMVEKVKWEKPENPETLEIVGYENPGSPEEDEGMNPPLDSEEERMKLWLKKNAQLANDLFDTMNGNPEGSGEPEQPGEQQESEDDDAMKSYADSEEERMKLWLKKNAQLANDVYKATKNTPQESSEEKMGYTPEPTLGEGSGQPEGKFVVQPGHTKPAPESVSELVLPRDVIGDDETPGGQVVKIYNASKGQHGSYEQMGYEPTPTLIGENEPNPVDDKFNALPGDTKPEDDD